jgi:two-component system sensor histidine kinase KdpD
MKQIKQFLTKSATFQPYMLTILACAITTVIAHELATTIDLANIVMLFLLAVFLISVRLGRGAGILAAFLSVALFDFFFVPPHFSFAVSDVQYLLTFAVMLVVALITGQLAASLHTQAELALAREQRTLALYEMARALSGALNVKQTADTTKSFLLDVLKLEGLLLLPQADGDLVPVTEANVWYERHMAYVAYENSSQNILSEPDGIYYFPLKGSTRMRGCTRSRATAFHTIITA